MTQTTGRRQSRVHLLGISGFDRYQVLVAGDSVNRLGFILCEK